MDDSQLNHVSQVIYSQYSSFSMASSRPYTSNNRNQFAYPQFEIDVDKLLAKSSLKFRQPLIDIDLKLAGFMFKENIVISGGRGS